MRVFAPSALASLLALCCASLACRSDEAPIARHYPMRNPVQAPADLPEVATAEAPAEQSNETEDRKPAERPAPDPEIERMLALINDSGLRFIDQADGEDDRPGEYTAEQFSSMLRSKWDWIGYDIVEPEPWLREIATRSFKSNLPYLVVLEDGKTSELRPWLELARKQTQHDQ